MLLGQSRVFYSMSKDYEHSSRAWCERCRPSCASRIQRRCREARPRALHRRQRPLVPVESARGSHGTPLRKAARNVAASGARPIAATNCLNFGSPEKPEVMWQFSETIDGLAQACTALGTPITAATSASITKLSANQSTRRRSSASSPYRRRLPGSEIAFRDEGDVILLSTAQPRLWGAACCAPTRQPVVRTCPRISSSEYSKTIAASSRVNHPP